MNSIHTYYLKHNEKIDGSIFGKMLLLLPEIFQTEINAYKHWESAQASLLGKIILLHALKELKIADSLNELQTGNKDRPHIKENIDFNISHSGEFVIVAIAENAKVGIDIEKHRTIDVSLFRKYFDDDEWNEIQTSDAPEKTFFKLWAIKECAIKCDGRGVEVLSLTHVSRQKPSVILCDSKEFYFQLLDIEENYSCSVCSDHEFQIYMKKIEWKQLEF